MTAYRYGMPLKKIIHYLSVYVNKKFILVNAFCKIQGDFLYPKIILMKERGFEIWVKCIYRSRARRFRPRSKRTYNRKGIHTKDNLCTCRNSKRVLYRLQDVTYSGHRYWYELLTNNINEEVKKIMSSSVIKTKLDVKYRDYSAIIRETEAPAVLLECGFVDN